MLTKYYLHIGDTDYELQADDLQNWGEIRCSYKRASYDGVVRSFTSQFAFVNKAKDLLWELYLKDRYNASASISVHTMNDHWRYDKVFECPLDFSTISYESYALKINSVDNSMAALIKANKSTKFEFAIDSDINKDFTFIFNRLLIKEALSYEISEGDTNETDGSLSVPASENDRTFCGITNDDEIYVGGAILWNDDQTKEKESYLIQALKDININLHIRLEYDQCRPDGTGMIGKFQIIHKDGTTSLIDGSTMSFGNQGFFYCGNYETEEALRTAYPYSSIVVHDSDRIIVNDKYWAVVKGSVWRVMHRGSVERVDWENLEVTPDSFKRVSYNKQVSASLKTGDKVAFVTSGDGAHIYSSSFYFSWITKGTPCNITAFKPSTVAESLLLKICGGRVNPRVEISDYDSRLKNTIIVAAESVRGIPNAKLYTSFNDFCDWMSTVFGYIYYIGEETDSIYKAYREAFGGYTATPYPLSAEPWSSNNTNPPTPDNIMYFECYGKFVAYDGAKWYTKFPGADDYNNPETGFARTDTIFRIRKWVNGVQQTKLYFFEQGNYVPNEYLGNISDMHRKFQTFHFVHRSEIMRPDANVRVIENCRDLKYSVDSSAIYSTVTAGYDKQNYEAVNGRDEFNFNNTYTTGCTVSEKTLSLLSKYRADCYGIEFNAQKRGAESTDSSSDKDVFFVLTQDTDDGAKVADMSYQIRNAASDELFNGAFSPMACIRANAGYIGLQADNMTLAFASSTGNSSIIINGEPMSADIVLNTPLATCGNIEFTTDDVDDIADANELIEVMDDGVLYRGFLQETDIKYAKTEAVRYKLIVKDIEI